MALVDWHFTWCDTVAVWFISRRTSTHGQPSSASDKTGSKPQDQDQEEEEEAAAARDKRVLSTRKMCARLAAALFHQQRLRDQPAAADWLSEPATDSYCTCHARRGRCARTDDRQ